MRVVMFGLLACVAGCKYDLQHGEKPIDGGTLDPRGCKLSTASICEAAGRDMPSDFAWLQANMFSTNCSGSDCHGAPQGSTPPSGGISLASGFAYKALLGKEAADTGPAPLVVSDYDPDHNLVEPGNPEASYLLYILHGLGPEHAAGFLPPPDDVGFMPQNNATLCCQKLDVVERWIRAGANP